jgi:hypothetical protein
VEKVEEMEDMEPESFGTRTGFRCSCRMNSGLGYAKDNHSSKNQVSKAVTVNP